MSAESRRSKQRGHSNTFRLITSDIIVFFFSSPATHGMNYRPTPSLRSSEPSLSPRTSSRNRNHQEHDLGKPPDSGRTQFLTTPNTEYYYPRFHTHRSDYLNGVSCLRKKSTIQRGASIWRSGDELLSSTELVNFVTPSNLLCNDVASVAADSPIRKDKSLAKSSVGAVRRKKTLPANRTDSTLVTRLHNIPRIETVRRGHLSGQQTIIKGELTSRLRKYSLEGNHELVDPTRVDFKKYSPSNHREKFPPDWWISSACPPKILDRANHTSDDSISSEESMVVANQHAKLRFGLKNDLLSNCRAAQNSYGLLNTREPEQSLVNESRFLDIVSKIYKPNAHECQEPQNCCLHKVWPAGDNNSFQSFACCGRRSLSNSKTVRRMTSGVDRKRVGESYAPTIQGRLPGIFPDSINGLGIVGRDEDWPRRENIGVVGEHGWERHLSGLATTRIYRSSPRSNRLPGGNMTGRVNTNTLVKPVEVQSDVVKPVQSGRRVVVRSRLYKGSCTTNALPERLQVPKSQSLATSREHRVPSLAIKENY